MKANKSSYTSLFSTLEKHGLIIAPEYKTKIEERLNQVRNYEPKVGVFGKTGVGKSSLCNALFGQDICEISDIKACTRKPQEILLSIGGRGLKLLDVPGVGESSERDKEYEELYEKLLPELDLIFWVFKADDRAGSSDERFYKRLIRPYVDAGKPFLAVINQVDKIEPFREWNEEERRPGAKQSANIDEKRKHIAGFFDLPLNKVLPISANEKYNLDKLVDSIIHALPKEQKFIMLEKIHKAEEENYVKLKAEAEKAQAEAEKAKDEAKRAKIKAEEEQARFRYEKMKAEAEKVRAEAERAKIETIISQFARREAEASWLEIAAEVVSETLGAALETGKAALEAGKSALEAGFNAVKNNKWMPWNW
ncbi:GTPase family protein [Chloroherpeton thalassium]|nr:GTPase [Chloroherpeton thalassium]